MNEASANLQQLPPAPAGAMYIDLKEAARRLGMCGANAVRRFRLKKWVEQGFAKLVKPPIGKSRWMVREDADPGMARVKYADRITFDVRSLTDKQRATVQDRLRIVRQWDVARAAGVTLGVGENKITADFLDKLLIDENRRLSRATLFNWQAGYRHEGIAGLVDERWKTSTAAKTQDPFLEEIKRLYLDQRKRSVQLCYDRAADVAAEKGWKVCSYESARVVIKQIPAKTVALHRGGSREYDAKHSPFIERDYTRIVVNGAEREMWSNDVWCFDHHQFDVWVSVPGRDKLVRPWLTGIEDVRSRKMLGWKISPDAGNSATIIAAIRMAVEACGAPIFALTDNGKDFDAWTFQGVTKKQRRRGDQPTSANVGLFGLLNAQVRHAKEFNAKGKPIERHFGTVCSRFSKLWDTYCGRNPQERPADLPDQIERGRAPSVDEFISSFQDFLDGDYHIHAHGGQGMDGRSPNEVYAACVVQSRPVDQRMLDAFFVRRVQPQKVGRNGVVHLGVRYGRSSLADRQGQWVILGVNDADLSDVQIFEPSGRFICVAKANERLPFFSTRDAVQGALADIKSDKKTRREYLDRRSQMQDTLTDRLFRRASRARQQQQPDPQPDSIKPVRNVLDDQLPAVQKVIDRKFNAVAVGAENLDLDSLRPRAPRIEPPANPEEEIDAFAAVSAAMRRQREETR